jgi:ATP adenylyltransferase
MPCDGGPVSLCFEVRARPARFFSLVEWMDYLWSPWRYRYVSESLKTSECIFCKIGADPSQDARSFVLCRARFNYLILNLYPYTTAHTMVVPYAHVDSLAASNKEALEEMFILSRDLEKALSAVYRPEGFNLGLNLGKCAGAGVAHHLHLHFLPRWTGDTNFMSVTAETRVLPEDLPQTYAKLLPFFR